MSIISTIKKFHVDILFLLIFIKIRKIIILLIIVYIWFNETLSTVLLESLSVLSALLLIGLILLFSGILSKRKEEFQYEYYYYFLMDKDCEKIKKYNKIIIIIVMSSNKKICSTFIGDIVDITTFLIIIQRFSKILVK